MRNHHTQPRLLRHTHKINQRFGSVSRPGFRTAIAADCKYGLPIHHDLEVRLYLRKKAHTNLIDSGLLYAYITAFPDKHVRICVYRLKVPID